MIPAPAMVTILDQIVVNKRYEVAQAKAVVSENGLEGLLRGLTPSGSESRRFHGSLKATPFIRVIAEVKRQSPSAGAILASADAVAVAINYKHHGAACISVLTDGPHFGGSLEDLQAVRAAVDI